MAVTYVVGSRVDPVEEEAGAELGVGVGFVFLFVGLVQFVVHGVLVVV